jgi:flagellar protein FlaI
VNSLNNAFGTNIIFVGSGSGKTTLMNALGACIPFRERIISIEDTLELQFPLRENWVQMESKPAILKNNTGERLAMDDLLKNSLRMRPDRVIVGEVRGVEAQTLFAAMDTGHQGSMGTLHANSPSETLLRLSSDPMNVPKTLLSLLNVIIVTQKIHFPSEGTKRRVAQVAEISHLEREPLIANIFERKPENDTILHTDTPSHCVQVLADATGKTRKVIQQELIVRQKILEWMMRQGIHTYADVEKVLQQYSVNPVSVLERIQGQAH